MKRGKKRDNEEGHGIRGIRCRIRKMLSQNGDNYAFKNKDKKKVK